MDAIIPKPRSSKLLKTLVFNGGPPYVRSYTATARGLELYGAFIPKSFAFSLYTLGLFHVLLSLLFVLFLSYLFLSANSTLLVVHWIFVRFFFFFFLPCTTHHCIEWPLCNLAPSSQRVLNTYCLKAQPSLHQICLTTSHFLIRTILRVCMVSTINVETSFQRFVCLFTNISQSRPYLQLMAASPVISGFVALVLSCAFLLFTSSQGASSSLTFSSFNQDEDEVSLVYKYMSNCLLRLFSAQCGPTLLQLMFLLYFFIVFIVIGAVACVATSLPFFFIIVNN